jgi:3-hydroxyisobutyrate dehydrogenase
MEICLLGTGLLGAAIGERLLGSGYRLTVWNRHRERCGPLQALGATGAATPAEAVAASDVVITVLSDGPTTGAVLLEQAGAALSGRLVLQVATIAPEESQALAAALADRGAELLEVPVLGSRPEALAGTLQLMVGGEAAALERARPVLEALGGELRLLGPVGAVVVGGVGAVLTVGAWIKLFPALWKMDTFEDAIAYAAPPAPLPASTPEANTGIR